MKKSLRFIVASLSLLFCLFTLVGCGSANIYIAFNNNSSKLPKSHILEEISYQDLAKKLDKAKGDENSHIYVFFGTPTDTQSCTDVFVYNEQAVQYGIETLYYVNSDLSNKDLSKLSNLLKVSTKLAPKPSLWRFDAGVVAFDSALKEFNSKDDVALSNVEIAQTCFDLNRPWETE